ncbi:hypothetical protein, partial [Rhodoblastus acidophilus]
LTPGERGQSRRARKVTSRDSTVGSYAPEKAASQGTQRLAAVICSVSPSVALQRVGEDLSGFLV